MIKRVPISILALVLSIATLAKTITLYFSNTVSNIFLIVALIFLLLLILKVILYRKQIIEETNLVVIPLLTLLPMALTALNSFFIEKSPQITSIVWYVSLILVILTNIFYIKKIIIDKNFKMILPSTFVNFVGIDVLVVNRVPSASDELLLIILYYSIASYIISLIAVIYCIYKYKNFSNITIPLMAIFAAPSALITVASISSGLILNELYLKILLGMNILGLIVYLIAFCKTSFKNFVPTLGAFTFPIVINAVAFRLLNMKLQLNLDDIARFYYYFAIAIVILISYKYCKHIFIKK
ncbi:MAG: hypothetical protein ACK5K7_03680 [Bacilli bacterium]